VLTAVQPDAPAAGLAALKMTPPPPPAPPPVTTHSDTDGHDTPNRRSPALRTAVDHADAPPVGSVLVTTRPLSLIATQSAADGQETSTKPNALEMTLVAAQADFPPVGSLLVKTLPALSTATHKTSDGHDTPVIAFPTSACATFHACDGSVEVTMLPALSTATHNPADGHERRFSIVGSNPVAPNCG
jgi:hypothetical protein